MDFTLNPWLILGFAGNAAFFSRFLIQWIVSERMGRSTIPRSFWYLSLVGSLLLLAYAMHVGDPIFCIAYLPNAFVYGRNLILIRRETHSRIRESRSPAAGPEMA